MLTVKIDTGNDAFRDGNHRNEVLRLLEEVKDRLERGYTYGQLADVNGNTVGSYELEL